MSSVDNREFLNYFVERKMSRHINIPYYRHGERDGHTYQFPLSDWELVYSGGTVSPGLIDLFFRSEFGRSGLPLAVNIETDVSIRATPHNYVFWMSSAAFMRVQYDHYKTHLLRKVFKRKDVEKEIDNLVIDVCNAVGESHYHVIFSYAGPREMPVSWRSQ